MGHAHGKEAIMEPSAPRTGVSMRTPADRLQQIENLLDVLGHLEIEPQTSVQLEAELLVAYSLVQIEKHLAEMKERRAGDALGFPQRL